MSTDDLPPTDAIAVHTVADTTVAVTLARLEGTINTNFAIIRGDINTTRGIADDHEKRIRDLEQADTPTRAEWKESRDKASSELQRVEAALADLNKWRWKMIGYFAAIDAVIAIAVAFAVSLISNLHH